MTDLEVLTTRIQNWAGRSKKRATVDEYQRLVSDRRNHTLSAITSVFEDHLGFATLRLYLAELDSLPEKDLIKLKTVLFEETADAMIREEGFIPESLLWERISPDDPNNINIFEHEWQHAAPLPDEIRAEAIMYFTFLEYEGNINLAGTHIAVGGSDIVHALSQSEPQWLTKDDAVGALRYARNTGNADFIDIITERIRHRRRHSWPGPVKPDWSDVLGKK